MALPSNISYGEIRGRFLRAVQDGPDMDRFPEGVPIPNVRVDITPDVSRVRDGSATPPTAVYLSTITLTSDANGVLVDSQGNEGVFMVAGDSPNIEPSGWTYKASISAPNIVPHSFHFFLPADGVVDLSLVVPVAADPGAELEAWLQAVAQAQAAVGAAQQQVGLAALEADRASDEADRAEAAADSIDPELIESQISNLDSRVTTVEGNVSSLTTSVAGKVGITDVASGQLYSRSGSVVAGQTFSSASTANTIAQRGTGGTLAVGEPVGSGHAATKGYVDLRDISLIDVAQFGAVGNGIADDTVALQAAINAEVPLYWGNRTYRITSALSRTLTKDLAWRADGARIILDRETSIQYAMSFTTGDFNVTIDGPLTLDCQKKAFTGWYFVTTTSTDTSFYARGLGCMNNYRASQAFTGGDGIWVRGRFAKIVLDNPYVKNSLMAAGAGIVGAQGVTGITISPSNVETGLTPGSISILEPFIDGVYCEDLTNSIDQDAIRILTSHSTSETFMTDTHFNVIGGLIRNPGGRSLKTSSEFGRIEGVKIERDSAVLGTGTRLMPEINFQASGGIVRDIDISYKNTAPTQVVLWSGVRNFVAGKRALGLLVDGVRVSSTGIAASMGSVINALPQEQRYCVIDVQNVFVDSQSVHGHFLLLNTPSTADIARRIIIRVTGCEAPLETSGSAVRRQGGAESTYVSIANFVNYRTGSGAISNTFASASTAGSFGVVLSGQNLTNY